MSSYSDFDNRLEARLRGRLRAEAWGETEGREIDGLAQRIVAGSKNGLGIGREYSRRSLRRWVGYSVAPAIIAIIVVCAVVIKQASIFRDGNKYRIVTTDRAQRARVQLPDGSTALLGPETRLHYLADFGKSNREVLVEGQVLFTVTHSAGIPFTVRSGSIITRVLGTSFSVRNYSGDSATQIVVAEGKVIISTANNRQAIVTTSGSASVSNSDAITIERNTDVATALSWTQGRLEFTRIPLSAVVIDAARMYNLDIHISSPRLASQLVTGVIQQSSPDDAIARLAATLGVKAERNGNTIILTE